MHRSSGFWLLATVLGVSLLTGCRTAPSGQSTPSARPATAKSSAANKSDRAEERSLAARAEAHAHYAAGVIHELNDQTDAALQEFYQAALKDPDNETLILETSWRFLRNKQPEKALEIVLSATKQNNASGEVYARLGHVYARLGRKEEAIAANRMAIKKSPRLLAGYRNLYFACLQAKQSAEALNILDEAAKQSNLDLEFLIDLATLYSNYAQRFPTQRETVNPKALVVLERADKLKPENPQLRLRLADGFFLAGNTDRAAVLYLGVIDALDDLPQARELIRTRLTNIYLRDRDHKRAIEQLEAIIRDDPSNAQAYYFLGSIAYQEERWKDMADYLKKSLLFNPDFEQAYYDLASAQVASGKIDDALATLRLAKGKFSQNFVLEYLLGVAQVRQKNYGEAIKHFTTAEVIASAAETNRLTHAFYFEVGAALERKGDRAQAESYFEKSIKLQPDFAEALNYLGYMWAERGERLDEARDLIARALKEQPANAAYLDSMGWVLFKQHQPKEALDYMLKAVGLIKEPDATLYDHLGDIYAALNDMDKAREAWRKSLAVEKSDAVQKKLEAPKPD